MARQLAIAKRVSLAGVGPDWGDECYAMMLPARYTDMVEADQIDQKTKVEQVQFQIDFLKKHFVSGKVKVFGSDELADMEADDVAASVALSDLLFAACMGDDLDPKDLSQLNVEDKRPIADAAIDEPSSTAAPTSQNTSPTS